MGVQQEASLFYSRQIWVTIAFMIGGNLLSQVLLLLGLWAMGYSLDDLRNGLPTDLSAAMQTLVLGLSQVIGYLIPGLLAARSLYGKKWTFGTSLWPLPGILTILLGILIFAASLPLTAYLATLNASFPISDWMSEMEAQVIGLLGEIILETSPETFVLVVFTIAVLPAIGEELIFRGLILPAMVGLTRSIHLGVWFTALMFGLIHMQFAGLLPRIFLGAVLGFLAVYSGRLWVPIIAHCIYNGAQVLLVRWGYVPLEQEAPQQADPLHLLFGAALAAGVMYYGLPYLRSGKGAAEAFGFVDEEADEQAPKDPEEQG